jgi:hypothetical protein
MSTVGGVIFSLVFLGAGVVISYCLAVKPLWGMWRARNCTGDSSWQAPEPKGTVDSMSTALLASGSAGPVTLKPQSSPLV